MTLPLPDDPIGPLIVRSLAGEASTDDEAELRRWLEQDPARVHELARIRALWHETAAPRDHWDTTALQRRILERLETATTAAAAGPRPRAFELGQTARATSLRWGFAAMLLVLAGGGLFVWRVRERQSRDRASAAAPLTELATQRGQRAQLRLSDGTRVLLGVDSRLRFTAGLADATAREVYLEGEAYFEVAHDSLRPFRVHAGQVVTQVLGTRFAVRAFPEDRSVRVVVAEGRVAVADSGKDDRVVLNQADLAIAGSGQALKVRHSVDVSSELAWVDGRLVFVDVPVGEVGRRLSRWYDVDVRVGDSALAALPYTMSLRGDEPVDRVLSIMAAAVNSEVERRGTAYVLVPQARVSPHREAR
jgi:transmembrane sensor